MVRTPAATACLVIPIVVLALAGGVAYGSDEPPAETPREAVDRILVLTDDEQDALDVAQTRKQDYEETALYIMLNRACQLPQLPPEQFAQLQRPPYRSLLAHPERYVGQPIRMTVLVSTVFKETSGTDHEPDLLWPSGRERWMIRCLDADGDMQQPMLVVSLVDPAPLLHKPLSDADEPVQVFNAAIAPLELAGVFYKVFEARESGTPEHPAPVAPRRYPLIIAWQLGVVADRPAAPGAVPMTMAGAIFIAVIALLVAFLFLARHIRRTRRRSGGRGQPLWSDRYRPLRDLTQDRLGDDEREADEVDPQLKAAVEDWRKEHPEDKPDG